MNLYIAKKETTADRKVVLDDLILTDSMPTSAGSRMLDGYQSLFDATVVLQLEEAGIAVCGKSNVGEFGIDLMGETSYYGVCEEEGKLITADAKLVKDKEVDAAVVLDVNGTPRRAAAQNGLVYIKPTYGTVSRFGTIPVVCSGETVGVMARNADGCAKILDVIAGHDDRDGTSLAEELCARLRSDSDRTPISKIAIPSSLKQGIDTKTEEALELFSATMRKNGVEVEEIDCEMLEAARIAWNSLLTAELCNNVSRYDGIKYGYRAKNYATIGELYTNSRTEAFGDLLKTAILYGSDRLSAENYERIYDKALRVRRVMVDCFADLFTRYGAILMPAASKIAYTARDVEENRYLSFEENRFTAPASITGLPSVVVGGISLIGPAFSECALLDLARIFEKGGVEG